MSTEGKVLIELPARPGTPVGVTFRPPADVTRLFIGKTPEEVLRLVPALHSVCATAQTHAAVLALEGALDITVADETARARQALTMMECLREHGLRAIMDWPRLMGQTADNLAARQAMTILPRFQTALSEASAPFSLGAKVSMTREPLYRIIAEAAEFLKATVFGEPLDRWLSRRGPDSLRGWAESAKTAAGRFILWLFATDRFCVAAFPPVRLPEFDARTLPAWLSTESENGMAEATSYIRRADDPLLTGLGTPGLGARFIARLVELARLPGEMLAVLTEKTRPAPAIRDETGTGYGAVQAARGPLIHTATIEQDRVTTYRMLPPTERNFASHGIAARCLDDLRAANEDERRLRANLVVNAIDPCFAYEVRTG
ncbi:hypothetical protein [Roseibium aggregatum]|uniref:Ni,Fe-hydrogenase I large subunit n=1 Tax=Roseibium aggregatum TaxID=187304 RepID=A0A926S4J2_9HYPH|nr:hypothetical protein [Roseibium aggregatum]MBD1545466.1 hypothetical protein [Roseibium aggregatum]